MFNINRRITEHNFHFESYAIMPDFLFFGKYRALSDKAIILYCKLVQKLGVALENGWVNERGELFVKCKRTLMTYIIKGSKPTVRQAYGELEDIGLIEIDRKGHHEIDEIYILLPEKIELTTEELSLFKN